MASRDFFILLEQDQEYQQALEDGMAPEVLSELVFQAIKDDQFSIIPHPEFNSIFQARMEAILQVRNPRPLAQMLTTLQ